MIRESESGTVRSDYPDIQLLVKLLISEDVPVQARAWESVKVEYRLSSGNAVFGVRQAATVFELYFPTGISGSHFCSFLMRFSMRLTSLRTRLPRSGRSVTLLHNVL